MILLASISALAQSPELGAGLLFQGLRPGLVAELHVPFRERTTGERTSTDAFVPTVSGWIHPGHYVPLQLHGHYVHTDRRDRMLIETSVGMGVTWVANARRTVRLVDDEVQTVPLAGRLTASPGIALGLGHAGRRRDVLFRVRLNAWLPWQHRIALSGNYELVLRFGDRP